MNDDAKPTEAKAPEPVVINPGGKDAPDASVKPEVKKAVMETPALETAAKVPANETPETQAPVKVEPQQTAQPDQPAKLATPAPAKAAPQTSAAQTSPEPSKPKKPKKLMQKGMLMAVVAGFFLVGGGAAAYITFFQKTPEDIWKSALNKTADGLDKFIDLSINQTDGVAFDGSLELTTPLVAESTFEGSADYESGNSEFELGISSSGLSLDAELKTLTNDTGSPEIYFKLKGLDSLAPLLGAYIGEDSAQLTTLVSSIDNQWYLLDNSSVPTFYIKIKPKPTISVFLIEIYSKACRTRVFFIVLDKLNSYRQNVAAFVV